MDNKIIKNIENRGGKCPPPKKNFNCQCCKDNTIKSLHEVEYFLNNFHRFIKYVKLYKILK